MKLISVVLYVTNDGPCTLLQNRSYFSFIIVK